MGSNIISPNSLTCNVLVYKMRERKSWADISTSWDYFSIYCNRAKLCKELRVQQISKQSLRKCTHIYGKTTLDLQRSNSLKNSCFAADIFQLLYKKGKVEFYYQSPFKNQVNFEVHETTNWWIQLF